MEHPQYENEVMEILKNKGALNLDGSIKDNLGINKLKLNSLQTAPVLYTGYVYTFAGSGPATEGSAPKVVVAKFSNNSNKSQNFSLTQTYTATTSIYSEGSIGAKGKLDDAFEINANVSLGYTYTQSASTQYGTNLTIPAKTMGTISARAILQCYSYFEQYYVLGVAVGNKNTIGVFKPTGIHWYYNETSI